MNNKPELIAIWGWAFNPPTIAHTNMFFQVLNETDIDKIILCPDGKRSDKDYGIPMSDKIEISRLYCESLKQQWLNIEMDSYFLEWKNNGPTTTIAVDKYFREKYWNDIWHIFWADVIPTMHSWEWNTDNYIEKKLKKVLLRRPGYPIEAEKYGIENYQILDTKFLKDISSTMVRNMILQGREEVSEIIGATQILDYIQQNNLYT